jgi:hypothetical protein
MGNRGQYGEEHSIRNARLLSSSMVDVAYDWNADICAIAAASGALDYEISMINSACTTNEPIKS